MKKFLSIIIPVYNVEKYLAECLDSCLAQDIPAADYEIICVNDGSTDGSAVILERYAREHSNVRFITQPNGGVSVARNTGIDAACGDYIWFVDPDDFIRKNCLAELRKAAYEKAVDKLNFACYEFENALSKAEQEQADSAALQPTIDFPTNAVWSSLYNHAFLDQHDLRFLPGLRYAEDGLFQYEFNLHSPVTDYYSGLFYFYRRNPDSLTRSQAPDVVQSRREASYLICLKRIESVKLDRKKLQETQAERSAYTNVLMPEVRMITTLAARFPAERRREIIKKLSDAELFPLFLYPHPRDWFPRRSHMSHADMGLAGKLVDILFFYSTTRLGFAALVLYYKLYNKKKGQAY